MSSSKRHFTAVVDSKEHGIYISSSPSSAARKIVSKLFSSSKSKKVEFCVRETTQKSEKKTYGPYLGEMKKLEKPIELKGRIIRYAPVVHLKKKKTATKTLKKIGKKIRGGGVQMNLFLCKEYCNINNTKTFSQNSGITYYLSTDDVESVVEKKNFEKRCLFFGKPEFIHFRKNIPCHPLYYQYVVYCDFFNNVKFEMYNRIIQTVEYISISDINEKSLYELKLFLEQLFNKQDIYYNIINNYVTQYIQVIENKRLQKRQGLQGLQEQLERLQEQKRLQNQQEQIQRLQQEQKRLQNLQEQIQLQPYGYMLAQV
jgi:hypothetical protein